MIREMRAHTANDIRSPQVIPPETVQIEEKKQTTAAMATIMPRTPVASIFTERPSS
jgi:hypothetical protein